MVFKLVRIDTQEPSKIQLSIGTHVIGRGKFLHDDDTDKRVSRNHAELEVTVDTVNLKSLHQNPCFYIKKSTDETQLLEHENTVCLCHGDKFGLIPEHFWYEVLHCPNQDTVEESNAIPKPSENGLPNGEEQRMNRTDEVEQNNATSETSAARDNEEEINFEDNGEVAGPNRSASQSLLTADQESTDEYEVKPQVPLVNDTSSTAKRSHSSRETSPVDVKKVKTESVDLKTEPVDAGDAGAGPSNGQAVSSDTDSKDKVAAPASPAKPNPPSRERCIYGANCYRRNPQHLAQFSHPSDADWGGGERGVCPYGRACRRADPRHWANHDHPLGVQPPNPNAPRPGKRQKRRQRNVSDSDEEDSPVKDLIVTGKRARKMVNRQDWSCSESDGDEDPYKTDESDEWQPSSDVTNSQGFSQDF